MDPRILVIRRGGLGDTLLMLPVLRGLRRLEPESRLHLAGVREHVDLLAHFGCVHHSYSVEDLPLWALEQDSPSGERARHRLRQYQRILTDDVGVASMQGPELAVEVFDPRPASSAAPLGAQLLESLVSGLDTRALPAEHHLCERPTAPRVGAVVLAPGSGSPQKCWPAERWLGLAESLRAQHRHVLVATGPVEQEGEDPWQWEWPDGVEWIRGKTVVELALCLQEARAFVGNDSGPTHLAAALWVPTVALFGPTAPAVWAPVGRHVHVLQTSRSGPPAVSVAQVADCLRGF